MSVPKGENGRATKGTFIDLMKCSESGDMTKGLHSLGNSVPDSPHDVASRLATDAKAFKKVSFAPESTAPVPMPLSLIKFAIGSTRGAITEWHQDPDGAATVSDVYLGWKAWAVVRGPGECNPYDSADSRRYREPHALDRANWATEDQHFEVILVGPRTRM